MQPPVKKGAKDSGVLVRPSQLIVINKKTANVKEAAKFVNWFFNSAEAAVVLGTERGVPAAKSALKALEAKKLVDPNMAKGIGIAVKNAGAPENAAEQMLKAINAKLAELKSQK